MDKIQLGISKKLNGLIELKVLAKKLVQVVTSKEGNSDAPCVQVDLTKSQEFVLMFSSTWPSFTFGFFASSLHLRRCDTTFVSAWIHTDRFQIP